MLITIEDDFCMAKIADCGQCFRAVELAEGVYRFVSRDRVLLIREVEPCSFEVGCTAEEWADVWHPYFDLDFSYRDLRATIDNQDYYLTAAVEAGLGIRVLRQDPWETLVSFIVSQRKSIPAIRQAIELLCAEFGERVSSPCGDVSLFPSADVLSEVGEESLRSCKLGYRAPYVLDAARKVASGELDLVRIASLDDAALLDALESVYGVGIKVASCVGLFGYHRLGMAPVDVWIRRVIDAHYGGEDPFPAFGEHAGIWQQYLFYHAQTTRGR